MKKRGNDLNGSDWARYSISVWNDIRKTTEERRLKHPAMFPEMLVTRLISCFTTQDELNILDPFMGSGTTLVAARKMGRNGFGFEINPEYLDLVESRLSQLPKNDTQISRLYHQNALQIPDFLEPASIDFAITSPPYWDILMQKRTADNKDIRNYGNNQDDLGVIQDYHEFVAKLSLVFKGVFEVLKPGKYCLVNVMDLRKRDKFFPLHSDLASKMQQIGFIFDDLFIWDRRQEYNNLRTLGYPAVFRINKIHEYILIFKKP